MGSAGAPVVIELKCNKPFTWLNPYKHAETLRNLFKTKPRSKDSPVFITNES